MSLRFAPKPLSPGARRGARQRGLLAETNRILRSVDVHGREAVMAIADKEIEELLLDQSNCHRKGNVVEAEVIGGRVAAWRFQVSARRVE